MRKTIWLAMALALAAIPPPSHAQQQPQPQPPQQQPPKGSLAEAARKAREERKKLPKPAVVYTNDNLPFPGGAVSVVGSAPAPPKEAAGSAETSGKGKEAAEKPTDKKGEEYWRKRFADARQKLSMDQQGLEVLQRELGELDKQYYPDPQKAMEQQYSQKDINEKRAKIADKQKEIEKDQQALADLEDEMRASGGSAGWARP
jgi:predicted RNase H-like nuclease (RuvC/YqgF family)